ncbi:hypothetical protein PIB30_053674 [Stylosanthes scabra]|uniref:Uncharacterized protein n=1 Tax=Stylosanthes scabra TaxID=79078 RepID=A0ABU6TJG2_9FABA|nr:hypothetical protein [Stylosanthes scabra]
MVEEIPINNEEGGENNHPQPTLEKGIDQGNQTTHQLEAALRELLERQTREAAIATEEVRREKELAKKQQAILDEAEKREKDQSEKLNGKVPIPVDDDSRIADLQDRTWKPSTVATKITGREKSKHPFSPHILAEELPKKFRYPMEIEPYNGTTDPKHHLDAFKNRMLLLHEALHAPLEAPKDLPELILYHAKVLRNPPELSGPLQRGVHADRRFAVIGGFNGFGQRAKGGHTFPKISDQKTA